MPVKRSRAGSSSSYLESPSETPAATFDSPVKVLKTDGVTEPPRPTLLAVASPVNVGESDQLKIGGFLERCHYCKKRIAQNSEVFMYSNLCAFCSAECRNSQIELDQLAEKKPENPKEKLVPEQDFCNFKDLSNV